MSDDLTALGPDGIRRSYDEHYDTMMDVKEDPTGAWQAIQKQAARIEELEAKLAKAVYKSAALVYSDMTEGDRVACDFATYLTETPVMQLDFLSTFCLEVKQKQEPVGVVFYLGNTVVGYENLQALGLRQTVRQGYTITCLLYTSPSPRD